MELLREFLQDLRDGNKMDLQTKRAVILQILCVNRPANTASMKWEHIDLENGTWSIPAKEMKMRYDYTIGLCDEAIKVLKEQKLFCPIDSPFVFPAFTKSGHLNRDSISKAIRNLGGVDKYLGKASAHGFRGTFRTLTTLNMAELLKLGVTEKTIENALAHKEPNAVKFAYERQTATIEQSRALMQWYADFLNSIVKFI